MFLIILALAHGLKVMVLSDLHIDSNMTYSTAFGSCTDLGKYGSDSTIPLFKKMLEEAKKKEKEIDAIIFTGDFMKNEYKASKNGGFERKWAVLLEHIANSSTMI